MKKALALLAALAASVSLAGTGVTQKQLTNAVDAAKDEMRGYTDDEIEKLTQGGTVVTTTEMHDYVRDATNNVSLDLNGSMTNAVLSVFDFIEADLSEKEPSFNPDGTMTIIHIDKSLDYPRRIKITLRPKMELAYSSKLGLKVISSSYGDIPEGTMYACVGEAGTNFWNKNKGTLNWEVATNTIAGSPSPYYRFSGTKSEKLILESNSPYLSDQNQIVVYRNVASMDNLVGSFTVEPYWLDEDEYAEVAGIGQTPAQHNEWVERYQPRLLGWFYGFEQLDNFQLSAPALKAPPRPPKPPPEDLPNYQNIPNYPNAPKYDWEDEHPGELEKDEFWEPESWYRKEDWNNPYNWLVFPVTVYIPYEYNGQQFTQAKECKDLQALQRYFKVAVPPRQWTAPEKKKKKDYCKSNQHIYVNCECSRCGKTRSHSYDPVGPYDSNCAQCKNHNTAVEHDKYAKGELKPTGETGERCTHICDSARVEYHTGWHHQAAGDPPDVYACSCYCGTYSAGKLWLSHDYSSQDNITEWHDVGDGQHHKGKVYCRREVSDPHQKEILKEHEIEIERDGDGNPTNVHPYDYTYHSFNGPCKKCEAKNLVGSLREHNIAGVEKGDKYTWIDGNEYTADRPFCYCTVCGMSTLDPPYADSAALHEWTYLYCRNDEQKQVVWVIACARCGEIIWRGEHDFVSENNYENDTHHSCYCGLHMHKHKKNDTSERCEGGYHWTESADGTSGEWVEVEKYIDDGCQHDWKEEKGTKPVPCDSGKGEPEDTENPGTTLYPHVPQGSPYPDPDDPDNPEKPDPPYPPKPPRPPKKPWRSIDDDCPHHYISLRTGPWVIEWDDGVQIRWVTLTTGGTFFLTGIYAVPVQYGTKYFAGNELYAPTTFRVMRYATWLEWWND